MATLISDSNARLNLLNSTFILKAGKCIRLYSIVIHWLMITRIQVLNCLITKINLNFESKNAYNAPVRWCPAVFWSSLSEYFNRPQSLTVNESLQVKLITQESWLIWFLWNPCLNEGFVCARVPTPAEPAHQKVCARKMNSPLNRKWSERCAKTNWSAARSGP